MRQPYKKPTVRSGDLNTPVTFYTVGSDDFIPGQQAITKVFKAYAQVYGPSQKDRQIMDSNDVKEGVTIKIRNTQGEFVPNHTQRVYIDDYHYVDQLWDVIDVRPDFQNDKFDVIVLANPTYKNRDELND